MPRPGSGIEAGPRSFLFVPADRALELLPKAARSGVDAIILDLEDGTDPAARAAARGGLAQALRATLLQVPCFVRVNELGGSDLGADLASLDGLPIAGIVVPKCEAPDVADQVAAAWPDRAGPMPALIAILETPAGVLAAAAIAASHPAVLGIALGAEDLALRTGMRRTAAGREILVARSLVVLAASAAGRWAIDTPSLELDDLDAVRLDAQAAADLGFTGKLLVHPGQVAPVHAAFAPTDDEVARAREVVGTADGGAGSDGAARAGSRMIDRPVIEAARRVIARADQHAKERR